MDLSLIDDSIKIIQTIDIDEIHIQFITYMEHYVFVSSIAVFITHHGDGLEYSPVGSIQLPKFSA